MYRWFQRQSAYTQFIILLSVSLLLFACFFEFWRAQISRYYRQRNEEYAEELGAQLQLSILGNYSTYSRIVRLVSYDKDLQDYLLTKDAAQRYTLFQSMRRRLSDVANLKGQILDIVVVDSYGKRINLSDMVYPLPRMELSDNKLHCSPLQRAHVAAGDTAYIVMGKTVNSIDSHNQTNQRIGWLYLVLSPGALTGGDILASSTSGTHIYLVDQGDEMLWSNGDSYTADTCAAILENPQGCSLFKSVELSPLPYRMIVCQPEPVRLIDSAEWPTVFFAALCVFAVLLIAIWGLFAQNIVRPCKELACFNQRISEDGLRGLSTEIELGGFMEAKLMGEAITQMLRQIQELTKELVDTNQALYESKLLKRQAELLHLRSQINPHFLYNPLETMVGIAYSEQQVQLAEIARSLSLIFKYSIKGGDLVLLRDELKIAQNYLLIQHYRFQSRFAINCDIPDSCLCFVVPKMILQPLIENSIVHGIEQQDAHFCHLCLRAEHSGGQLTLVVEDDGMGIEPERLGQIREQLSGTSAALEESEGGQIGLRNVDSRIKLMYGVQYGVHIESERGEGTKVSLLLPAQEKEAENVSGNSCG